MSFIRCKHCGRKRRRKKKPYRIEKPCSPCIRGALTPEEERARELRWKNQQSE